MGGYCINQKLMGGYGWLLSGYGARSKTRKPRRISFPRFSTPEFSILHYTQNGKLGDENLGVLFQAFLPNSEFSILHYTQNGKLGVGNLGVLSEVYQNSDFFKLLNQTPRFSNSEFSILHYTQNGKLRDGKPRSLIRRCRRKL